jgi:hypothetical protein
LTGNRPLSGAVSTGLILPVFDVKTNKLAGRFSIATNPPGEYATPPQNVHDTELDNPARRAR